MAADNKIWVIALFMIISFVFNWLKRKRQSEKSESFVNEEPSDEGSSWGIGDIIDQFEVEYGNKKSKLSGNEGFANTVDKSFKNDTLESFEVEDKIDEKNNVSDTKRVKVDIYSEKEIELENEKDEMYDLKEMVIHNAILNRPKF